MLLRELQLVQAAYDAEHWHLAKAVIWISIRHICLHLTKKVGILAAWCEQCEHDNQLSFDQIKRELVPDLLIHALRLANLFGLDLETVYHERMAVIRTINGPQQPPA